MLPYAFSNKVTLRFTEKGHMYIFAPYSAAFVADLKAYFYSQELKNSLIGTDPALEYEPILQCWIVYSGWKGCAEWIDIVISLLNKHFPIIT